MFDNVNYDLNYCYFYCNLYKEKEDVADVVKDAGRISLTFVYLH